MPMLWIALHLPQLPLEALQRGLPSPEPCAVDFRYDAEPVRLLPENEMRSLVAVVIGFVVGEVGE